MGKKKQKVKEMIIDECAMHCPFRVVGKTPTLSDHNAILLTIEIPRAKKNKPDENNGNWIFDNERFPIMSRLFDEQCMNVDTEQETQLLYDDVEELIDKTLDQCFKKQTRRKTMDSFADNVHHVHKAACRKLNKFAARGKVQRKVAQSYRERILQMNTETVAAINNQKLQERIKNISENDKFSAQKFWKEKKALTGSQRTCTSVFDKNGKEIFDPEAIIAAYQNEFENRLTGAQMKASLQEYKDISDRLCIEILKLSKTNKVPDIGCKIYPLQLYLGLFRFLGITYSSFSPVLFKLSTF